MAKLGVVQFHRFMRGDFSRSIRKAYLSHHIFCEADLQSFAWYRIRQFLKNNEETPRKFRVLNKPFLRDCRGTYPDLVVFRGRKPWVVIELKEGRSLPEERASTEREKLLKAKGVLKAKRGYLVYVARYGESRALTGAKGDSAYYFFEVPIVLWKGKSEADKGWINEFRSWSKYVAEWKP